jgi:hypothetical protein
MKSQKFYTQGIEFENINTVLKIYKKQQKTLAEVLTIFTQESNKALIVNVYDSIEPITIKEAMSLANSEQRAAALKHFPIEEIIVSLKAKLVDKQTIKKSQVRWDENLKPYKYDFEDTYELYAISANALNVQPRWGGGQDYKIYFVKCKCASTDRQYYLYVPEFMGLKQDAIEAIAWTMRFDNQPLSKQQYLNLMYSET